MKKRNLSICIIVVLWLAVISTTSGQAILTVQIKSSGTINYISLSSPTPTPTPTPTATPTPISIGKNFAVIPDAWFIGTPWGDGNNFIYEDVSVEHTSGAPSLRIESDYWHNDRAGYATYWTIAVKPGDHILFSCWIKTGSGSGHDGDSNYGGGRIGLDLYCDIGGGAIRQEGWAPNEGYVGGTNPWQIIPYGTDWSLMVWNLTVPSTYYGFSWVDQKYYTGTPAYIAPWIQAIPYTGAPSVWFADAQLYINPN